LAGSENIQKSGVVGDRKGEADAINKGLLELGILLRKMLKKEKVTFTGALLIRALEVSEFLLNLSFPSLSTTRLSFFSALLEWRGKGCDDGQRKCSLGGERRNLKNSNLRP
jgi:hypothetical protein